MDKIYSDRMVADINKDPYRYVAKVVFSKWKPHIIRGIALDGSTRFNVFRRRLGITEKVLTDNLQEMESDGLISRKVYAEVPARVEYELTEAGKQIIPILNMVYNWGWHQMSDKGLEINPYGEMWHGYREKDVNFMKNIDNRKLKKTQT